MKSKLLRHKIIKQIISVLTFRPGFPGFEANLEAKVGVTGDPDVSFQFMAAAI